MGIKEYKRKYHLFSLCGLNCGLCPRYQSVGISRCPGCGGKDFNLKHPSCAVITCGKKHGDVEYCFECKDYPCNKYKSPSDKDSFITYQNVTNDMKKAADNGIKWYQALLNYKISFLEYLLNNFNDGRKKNFYCLAVNLLDIEDITELKECIKENVSIDTITLKERTEQVVFLLSEKAKSRNLDLKLKK